MFEKVLFAEEEEADELICHFDTVGQQEIMSYLKNFHYSGEHEVTKQSIAVPEDEIIESGRYAMIINRQKRYIGLEYQMA